MLKDTEYSTYYSVDYAAWAEEAAATYQAVNAVLSQVSGSPMLRHEYAADGVAKTTYENGVSIYVNYNGEEVSVDGLAIPAKGYIAAK